MKPKRVNLRGRVGEEISRQVKIVPKTDEPFSIRKVSAVRGKDIVWELEEVSDSGEKSYVLHIKNSRKKPGRYYDSIHLETESERLKRITIPVSGIIQPAQ